MCSSAAEIVPNLWLGNIKASRNKDFIHKNKINCIINCTKNYDFDDTMLLPDTKKIRLPVSDTGTPEAEQELLKLLDRAVTYIQRQLINGDRVLVHCYAGKQRSVAVVVAYIIKYCSVNRDKALDVINRLWNNVYPDHYLTALLSFAERLNLKL
jgi:protein-tyrosine phosphatase